MRLPKTAGTSPVVSAPRHASLRSGKTQTAFQTAKLPEGPSPTGREKGDRTPEHTCHRSIIQRKRYPPCVWRKQLPNHFGIQEYIDKDSLGFIRPRPQQQRLYLYCKAQYYAEKRKPLGDSLCFTMNQSKWSSLYGLYERSNARGFYRDMTALMDHGFVERLVSGRATRTKNIYRFSSAWTAFGTEDFKLPVPLSEPLSEMHVSLS